MSSWEKWCELNGATPIPASPISIANFISDNARRGIALLWGEVCQISRAHNEIGLADPTLSEIVTAQINVLSEIKPPRSWKKEHWPQFMRLPWDLQRYLVEQDTERSRYVRRAQNEFGLLCETCKVRIAEIRERSDDRKTAA